MSTTCDQCGESNPADIHTCGAGVWAGAVQPTAWPLATEEEKAGGWTLSYKFLESLSDRIDGRPAMETIESILMLTSSLTPPAQPAPASWMEMVTANLVREGVNKHKARELAEHFYSLAPAAQPAPCTWTKSNDPHMPDTFDATCGVVWTFTDGGPAENDVRFCPGCGAAVNVDAPEPEEDLYDLAVKADNWGQP